MRLTLRTLLAWLDEVLPEAERGPLGEKVAASPVARQLVDRIEAVTARPQVSAPRVDGRGLAADPNSVAQYLDNTLPTEQLAPFERVCLESDSHLAEVASCHRMLAELAADPGILPEFDAAGRARLLAALRHVGSAQSPVPSPDSGAPSGGRVPRTTQATGTGGMPRRRVPWLAWLSASAAILLVAALGGLLARSLVRTRDVAPAAREAAIVRGGNLTPPAGAVVADAPAPETQDGSPAVPAGAEGGETVPASVAMVASPATDPAAAPPTVTVTVPVGQPVADAASASAPSSPPAESSPVAVIEPAAPPASVPIVIGGEWPVLWRPQGGAGDWSAGLPGTALPVGADLVVPPGCTPEIIVADVGIRLLPQSRAVITVAEASVPRLEVVFGRTIVRSSRPDATLALAAAGLAGSLGGSLAGGVAVEVSLARQPGDDPATVPALTAGRMVPVATGVRWLAAAAPGAGAPAEVPLESRRSLSWDARDPGAITVAEPGPVPVWVAGDGAGGRLERAAAAAFRSRLQAGETAERALAVLAVSRRVEERSMAAAALALLGRFDALAALLVADAPPLLLQNRQWDAVETGSVPLALARGANAAARLRQAIVAQAPAATGHLVWRLALGFTPEEIAAGAAGELVKALGDDALVVRRYALLRLVQATHPTEANRLRYRPDAPADRRRAGVEWWQRWLNDGQAGHARARSNP